MADTQSTVAAPATVPSQSSQSSGNSYSTDNVERVEGPLKTDFGAAFDEGLTNPPAAAPDGKSVTATADPAQAGQSAQAGKDSTTIAAATPPAAPVVDDVQKALDYYGNLAGVKPADAVANAATLESQPAGNPSAITAAITTIGQDKTKAALVALGYTDAQAGELLNAPTLAGRHGAEIGQLRKDNQQFSKGFEVIKPVLEFDSATGAPKGFNGLALLELATQQYGPDEVQRQLATKGVKLVPLNWQPSTDPNATADAVMQETAAEIAKTFGINVENLTPDEIQLEIDSNSKARLAQTRLIAQREYQESRQSEVKVQQTQAQQQAEREQIRTLIQGMEKDIPHFKELEPVMIDLYQRFFSKGSMGKVEMVPLLRAAAEGLSIGSRLKPLIALAQSQARKDERSSLLKLLGIPESEVNIDATASRQVQGAQPFVRRSPMEFDPTQD